MGTFGKTLSLISFVIGITISILVYLQYSEAQSGMMKAVSGNMSVTGSYWQGDDEEEAPTLSTMRVAAPKGGSAAKTFEIEHVDASAETGTIVYDDDTGTFGEDVAAAEPEGFDPPEDATFGELAKYYFEAASIWLFGEREETLKMDCKAKEGGGKVCNVSRG
jgi:hypothetical protein